MTAALARRALTVPGVLLCLGAALAASPLWIPAAALADLLRGRRSAVLRTGLAATWVLLCESAGVLAAGALWVWHAGGRRDTERCLERHFALQRRWADALFRGCRAIFGFELVVEGRLPASGPILLLMRHASLGDTLLPAQLLSIPYGFRLRYVLKRELLWDPCLDLVGHRLPNAFVDRDGPDGKAARAAVSGLAKHLGEDEGVMIYPEGTRFSPEKRRRAVERVRERGDPELARHAETLRHLLPPRPGGAVALLDHFAEQRRGWVVVCVHRGFEGSAGLSDLLEGRLVGRRIRVRCTATPAGALPADRHRWLLDAWSEADAWLGTQAAQE